MKSAKKVPERRKYPRREQSFRVQVFKHGLDYAYEGTSLNVSQRGAFIEIKKWRSFKVHEQAVIAFFLPPEYTGQNKIIQLQGETVITRVDQKNQGIGVNFTRNFKQFEPVILPDAVGQG